LIATGTTDYAAGGLARLPGAAGDVDRVAELFASLDYTQVLTDLSHDPTAAGLRFGLEDWFSSPERRPDDCVVVYYTGRCAKSAGRHYLMCADSRMDQLDSTAIPAQSMGLMLAGDEEHGRVLVILDIACPENGSGEIVRWVSEFGESHLRSGSSLWMIAVARERGQTIEHSSMDALATALAAPRAGAHQPFIDPAEIGTRIKAHLDARYPDQRAQCITVGTAQLPPFFPNPNFVSDVAGKLDVETLARMRRERIAHFDPRGRGVEYASETGNYFIGRTAALTTLAQWLAAPAHDRRARIVTGGPGSGKSALLGRLILLADGTEPVPGAPAQTIPPKGSITTHLHLHRRTLDDIVGELAAAVGAPAASLDELLVTLGGRTTLCTLLLDGLDEAGTAGDQTEALLIARELLRPLSSIPSVRLIVGTRQGPVQAIGAAVETIDLDTDTYSGTEDAENYVRTLLLRGGDPGSPPWYRQDPGRTSALASGIAKRAGRSFLVAYMTARALISGRVEVDVSQPGWERQLPSEIGEVFASYLARFGKDERRVRRLLAPLAYAHGQGLPWDNLWAPLATALSGEKCSDDDISWLFEHAGAYILDVPIGERSVFRLYHEALAEYLSDPRRMHEVHRRITETLLAQVPQLSGQREWQSAHPYIRTYLAAHAARANALDHLVVDPDFLVHADPTTLLSVIKRVRTEAARYASSIYRASANLHRHADAMARRQILAFDASRYQAPHLSRALSASLAWRVRWATGSAASPSLAMSLLEESHSVQGAACLELDGSTCVVTAGIDGSVRVWDIDTGNPLGCLHGHIGEVNAVSCIYSGAEPLAVTGGSDGTVRVWNLRTESECQVLTGHLGRVNAVACGTVAGRPVAVTGGDDRTVRLWDVETGREQLVMTGHTRWVRAVAFAEMDGRPIAITGASDSTIRVWDLESGREQAVLSGHSGEVTTVTCLTMDDQPMALTGGDDRTVRLWDLRTRRQRSVFSGEMDWVRALDWMMLDGRPVFVCGTDAGTAHVRDLRDGAQRATFTGHGHWIRAVVCMRADGRDLVVTAAADGSVCVWDPRRAMEQVTGTGHSGEVNTVAGVTVAGDRLVLSGGDDRVVRLWDLDSGQQLTAMSGHTGLIRAIATGDSIGRPIAITGSSDGTARIWDLKGKHELAMLTGHTDWVGAVACSMVKGRPVAVTGGDDCTVRLCDLSSIHGDSELAVLSGHTGGVNAVACTVLDGRPVAITGACDGSVRLWDLETGYEQGMLTGHAGWVRAVACTTLAGRPVVVSGGDDRVVRIWDLRDGQQCAALDGATSGVNAIACPIMAGQALVLAGSLDRTVRAWDLETQRSSDVLVLPYPVWALAVCPTGELVVATGREVAVYERGDLRA
jgi:WD40 repeat protein